MHGLAQRVAVPLLRELLACHAETHAAAAAAAAAAVAGGKTVGGGAAALGQLRSAQTGRALMNLVRVRSHRFGENEPIGQQTHRESALDALMMLWRGFLAVPAGAQGLSAVPFAQSAHGAPAAARAQLSQLRGALLRGVCGELWGFALAESQTRAPSFQPRRHGVGSEAGTVAVSALLQLLAQALGNCDEQVVLEPCVRAEKRGIASLLAALFVPRSMAE